MMRELEVLEYLPFKAAAAVFCVVVGQALPPNLSRAWLEWLGVNASPNNLPSLALNLAMNTYAHVYQSL